MSNHLSKPSEYVTLVSNDGFEFIITRSAAYVSAVLKRMLDPRSNFSEARENRAVLENINGVVLEKVCDYFYYALRNEGEANVADMEFAQELILELLIVADYLKC